MHENQLDRAYRDLAGPLLSAIRLGINAPDADIEDACQSAWVGLVARAPDVREQFQWLTTTARREAVRLSRLSSRDSSLETLLEEQHDRWEAAESSEGIAQQHELLRLPSTLPARQQRVLWLKALGFGYGEIADETGDTVRTVQRQLLRARSALRRAAAAQ